MSNKWNTSNAKIVTIIARSLLLEEQEHHINISRKDKLIYVDCSSKPEINKLRKNPNFYVEELLTNPTKNKILAVKGILPYESITIRKTSDQNDEYLQFPQQEKEDKT
nr:hypothetical protein [Candidatus Woesearchaeota archaeon]